MRRDWHAIYKHVARLQLAPNGRHRGQCPACGSANTFSVSRSLDGTFFKCFSASCDISGRSDTLASVKDLVAASRKLKINVTKEVQPLNVEADFVLSSNAEAWLLQHPGVYRSYAAICDVSPLWGFSSRSILFPIYLNGRIVDGTVRSEVIKRWKKLSNTGLPFITQTGGTAIIVEDPVSAYFRPDIFSGTSLNGTKLTARAKTFLAENYDRAVVALDRDIAPSVVMKMQRELGELMPTTSVRLLKDLKWYSEDESDSFVDSLSEWIKEN